MVWKHAFLIEVILTIKIIFEKEGDGIPWYCLTKVQSLCLELLTKLQFYLWTIYVGWKRATKQLSGWSILMGAVILSSLSQLVKFVTTSGTVLLPPLLLGWRGRQRERNIFWNSLQAWSLKASAKTETVFAIIVSQENNCKGQLRVADKSHFSLNIIELTSQKPYTSEIEKH